MNYEIMNYEDFITEIPEETKALILKTIDIYSAIENQELVCNAYNLTGPIMKKALNKTDKKCVSLFLASLLNDGDIAEKMNECDVTAAGVISYLMNHDKFKAKIFSNRIFQNYKKDLVLPYLKELFNFKIGNKDLKKLTDKDYKKYFEEEFKLLLKNLKEEKEIAYGTLSNDMFFAEIIIYNLAFGDICGSNVIKWLYNYNHWHDDFSGIYYHSSYEMIKNLMEKKLKDVGKTKKEYTNPFQNINLSFLEKEIDSTNDILKKYGEFLTEKNI